MMDAYRISDVVVTTYDGRKIELTVNGIFRGSRLSTENMILDSLKGMKKDIPCRATFHVIPI